MFILYFYQTFRVLGAFMTGKSEYDYIVVATRYKELTGNNQPRHTVSDFETALQNALRFVFAKSTLIRCYLHFCKVKNSTYGIFYTYICHRVIDYIFKNKYITLFLCLLSASNIHIYKSIYYFNFYVN